jgi:hypothetical protein
MVRLTDGGNASLALLHRGHQGLFVQEDRLTSAHSVSLADLLSCDLGVGAGATDVAPLVMSTVTVDQKALGDLSSNERLSFVSVLEIQFFSIPIRMAADVNSSK